MYRLTARQIRVIALLSGLFAALGVVAFDRYGRRLQLRGDAAPPEEALAPSEVLPAGITDPSLATDERNNIEVYKAISPGVVFITSTSVSNDFFDPGERSGTGSGSIIDAEGHILTNHHVIAGAQRLTVDFGGERKYPAEVIGQDPDTDLAVIKVDATRDQLNPVPLGNSDNLTVGQKVLAIGNPFGLDRTLTTGVISGLQRPIRARTERLIEGAIQTDASINPGNSGGPLLDSQGRMIGINSQILSPAGGSVGVGFAVPVNIARRVIPQLISNGFVNRPKLGIFPYDVEKVRTRLRLPVSEGVLIYQADRNGAAAAAGLRGFTQDDEGNVFIGDIIIAINGEKIDNNDDLTRALDKRQVGDTVQVDIIRDNRKVTVPVRLLGQQQRGLLRRRV
ncbi:MAG: trypsin-like peptidase domain-containing protein [Pyrinomonadaceae bacterium]